MGLLNLDDVPVRVACAVQDIVEMNAGVMVIMMTREEMEHVKYGHRDTMMWYTAIKMAWVWRWLARIQVDLA